MRQSPPASEAPRNERGYPALVMAHGTSGGREQLTHYIPRFTAAGMHLLLFDYRPFGASDGEPRRLLSVRRQLQDYTAALDCIRKVPGVDPGRVGVGGSSLSGGHVVDVAVTDGRVAAVIAQAPPPWTIEPGCSTCWRMPGSASCCNSPG
jgi:uncharacterized protein